MKVEWQATASRARRHLRTINVDGRDEWEKRLLEPFAHTLAEKDAWLEEAWELGQKRIALYNENADNFAIDEGLYAITIRNRLRQWHQTIHNYLGKAEEDILPLKYTGAEEWGSR